MTTNALVQARIEEKIKKEAAKVLAEIGLTISDAVRILLTRVAKEKEIPFTPLKLNKLTTETMEKSERGEELHTAKNAKDLFKQLEI